jgi:uncharacterized protein (DUF488 family)
MAFVGVLYTVGHGTASREGFVATLRAAGVVSLVDVRIGPGSRKFPHFSQDLMAQWLPEAGINYRWEQRLGGFRKLPPESPDTALRNDSFRAYASYMRSEDFRAAAAVLVAEAHDVITAIMCSETLWWRCHRRLIADHCVLLAGMPVEHLGLASRPAAHVPTAAARVLEDSLRYDVVA